MSRLAPALVAVLAALACRTVPPTSGTPIGPGESLALGVVREHHGWGLRRADLVSAGARLSADLASLLGASEANEVVVCLLPPANLTALPAPSFAPLREQLLRELVLAAKRRGLRLVRPGDPAAAQATHEVRSEMRGLSGRDLWFLLDYRVVERAPGADPARKLPYVEGRSIGE